MDNQFLCQICGSLFTRRNNLSRHIQEVHENKRRYSCTKCGRLFHRPDVTQKHERTCIGVPHNLPRSSDAAAAAAVKRPASTKANGVAKKPRISLPLPSTSSTNADAGPRREKRHPTEFRCRLLDCDEKFTTRRDLMRHRINKHVDPEHQRAEWSKPFPWINEDGEPDSLLRGLLEDSRLYIFDKHRHGNLQSTFNFPLNPRNWSGELSNFLRVVRESTREAIKINLSLGMVLQHRETDNYRYFVAGDNVPLLSRPERLDNQADWDRFLAGLQPDQLMERLVRDRPDTKWRLALVTNLRVDVAYLGVNMGNGGVPDYISRSKNILSLVRNKHGCAYNDTYCAFRALAANRNLKHQRPWLYKLERETRRLQQLWGRESLNLSELPQFEELFAVCVDIYSIDEDEAVYPRYLSERKAGERLVLNLYHDHLSLVINVERYLDKFKCVSCNRHFTRLRYLKDHRGRCSRTTRIDFTHEHYRPTSTVFEELYELGLDVALEDRVYPWFATFDCESLIKQRDERSDKLHWVGRHEVISVSVCSNINGYRRPKCFVDVDQVKLSTTLCEYLERISGAAYSEARSRWADVFDALEADPGDKALSPTLKSLVNSPGFQARQEEMYKKFHGYCRQLPTLGFNSSNYDLNVLKSTLFSSLGFGSGLESVFVIKKNNSYTTVSTPSFRFLDVSNYLAPGFSYAQFLRAYGITEEKSYFPYEWFDDASKLDYRSLPSYEAFYSNLKKMNVLENGEGEEIGRQRHTKLEKVWRECQMTTFRDFLIYYNNLDTYPMVLAIEKMQEFYFSRHIDLFKIAVSVPGIARCMLYKTASDSGVSFSSVRPGDDDLYYLIKKNIVGGPSLIFTREHEVGRTKIRGNDNILCSNIIGYDANALYLNSLDQFQPCGDYVRRFATDDFRPMFRGNRRDMFDWLDFIAKTEGLEIWHGRNHGEVKIGQYEVDGFVPQTKLVLEYDGCYFHGCERCGLGKTEWRERKRKETKERREWLEKNDYTVRTMKEHDFLAQIQNDPNLRAFVNNRRPPFYRGHKGSTSMTHILQAVKEGPQSFFGFLDVDICVPDHLVDRFSEMCPLFTNTDVSFDDIGETMKAYVRKNHLSEKPRRLLVAGLAAKRILLSSELLKWYLEKGLVVKKIHQVIEYVPVRCFRAFVQEVSQARRRGDTDATLKIFADTMKLIGNSAYGSMIMNKEKHLDVKFHRDVWGAQQAINSPSFSKLSEISDDLYEISSSKKRLRLDLPIQLGFHILQLAKLRMLQFYFDFLEVHCQRSKFEMIEMDTDSNYLALGGKYINDHAHECAATSLEHIAKNRSDFILKNRGECSDNPHTPDEGYFLPRICCKKHAIFDSRTPGLFKLEAEGDLMVGLCSKTYVLRKRDAVKVTSKGLRHGALADPVQVYRDVLSTGVAASGVNRGFRIRYNTIYTYEQESCAIPYLYCKREVMEDGIHTKPLQITLCPWPSRTLDVVVEGHPLWPDRDYVFELSFGTFHSLKAVCDHAFDSHAHRDEMVKEALTALSAGYDSVGELVFVAEGSFSGWAQRKMARLWTSGMSARCVELVPTAGYQGLNHLATLYQEVNHDDVF